MGKISISSLSEEQVNEILNLEENHFLDVKSKEIKPAKLTKTLSAFANSDGGEIYIGINESTSNNKKSNSWFGFNDVEEANGHIQVIQELFPFQQYMDISFLRSDNQEGIILKVFINKTKDILKAHDGIPYVRRGAQNLPIKGHEELKKLEFEKGITSFEQNPLSIPIETISESETIHHFIREVIPSTLPTIWLKKQLLVIDSKPTVAGVLLFSDEPQAALPKQSGIKIFRYQTKEKEGNRQNLAFNPITIEGSIYVQIEKAVEETVRIVEEIKSLGKSGFEIVNYPHEAIHEIITNAVLHRDYSIPVDVKIIIFDNRIEIYSPGKLPGHVTPENILEEQFARNGALVRIINKFPDAPNKDVGEGLNTAFSAMRKLRLKEPEILEKDNNVIVIIKHEPLASPENIVMEYLERNEEISNSTGRSICGIDSENKMKGIFQKLQKSGLLERTPGKLSIASTWRKPIDSSDCNEQKSLF